MNTRLNKYKYPGAKRLMLEAQELKDPTEDYYAQPIDDNLFEWHFTLRGPPDTPFDCGFYHGRLSFPTEYPMKPPSIIVLTPNGRFETNKKICLSISGYHPETWQPSWSVRTALIALIAFMQTKGNRAIGSLDFSDAERRRLAVKSHSWRCETCGLIKDLLKDPTVNIQPTSNTDNCRPGSSCNSCDKDSKGGDVNNRLDDRESGANCDTKDEDNPLDQASGTENSANERRRDPAEDSNADESNNDENQQQRDRIVEQEIPDDALSDRRKAYSSLVLKCIFVLLSLLILRRVVMLATA